MWWKMILIGFAAGVITYGVVAHYINRIPRPGQTRYVYIDRPEPTRLRIPTVRPATVYLYRVRHDTVSVRLPLPRDFGRVRGILRAHPLDVSRRAVSLFYWSPDSLRFIQERYAIPERTWQFTIDLIASWREIDGFYGGAEASLRRRSWLLFGGAAASADGGSQIYLGVRKRLLDL